MASEGALYLFITMDVDILEMFLKYQIRQQTPKIYLRITSEIYNQ